MSRKRTRAREIALQALYQFDMASRSSAPIRGADELHAFVNESSDEPEVREYARFLISGVIELQAEIDQRIASVTENWKLERIATVDRCILRLALYELLESEEVPPKVVINEAIELAKRFSTAQSGAFVNGVLDRMYRELVEEFGSADHPESASPALRADDDEADSSTTAHH